MERVPRRPPGGPALLVAAIVVGSSLLMLSPNAAANKGGPDSYGYIWVDSRPPSPTVSYSWVDILTRGTRLSLGDNDCTFEVNLGFQFKFYGTITDYIYICSDGFVTFSVPDSFTADPPIPSTSPPNNRVVALGMVDLDPSASGAGGVYFLSEPTLTPKRFTVTWNNVVKWATSTRETFQIVLEQNETTKDGRILMQYRSLVGIPSVLVGIENRTGTSGLAYPNPLENSLAVAFLPPTDAGLPPDTLGVARTILAPGCTQQGTSNVPMVRLDFTTATNWVDVTALRVVLSGVGAGPEDVTRARLWLDDGDGSFVPGADLMIATGTFSGTPPTARLEPSSPVRATTVASPRVYVTYDLSSTAGIGDWIGARLPDSSFVSVAFPDIVSNTGFPIETYASGARTCINASQDILTLSQSQSLLPTNVSQWETDVSALSLRLAADRNFVNLAGIRVSLGGTAAAPDAWAVKALRDLDADGNYTPGTDVVLAIAAPSGSPPAALLPFALTVAAGVPERVLILLDVAPQAVPGHVLNVTINVTDIQLQGSSDTVSGANFPAVTGDRAILPGVRPALVLPWTTSLPRPDGVWMENEYLLGPNNTAALDRPAGNILPGYVAAENSGTTLFLAVDAVGDVAPDAGDGLALVFDTDRDGLPTPGADDVFRINGTDGEHHRYNASAGDWTLVGPCTEASTPSCSPGTGITAFGRGPHRFYEFSIPLATLGLAPGNTVHFAIAGPPYGGVRDAGGRSTWPLLYGVPLPSLAHLGALVLSPGPLPNQPPSLDWTGEPGYETDGLEPEQGNETSSFRWKVLYIDPDNDPPTVGEPRLFLFDNGIALPFSPFPMAPDNPKGGNYRLGVPYHKDMGLPCGGNYTYYMTARDARGLPAIDTPVRAGPLVACPDRPPTLAPEPVSPFSGTAGEQSFQYRVVYADPENTEPVFVETRISQGGIEIATLALNRTGWVGANGSYVEGALYEGSIILVDQGTNYTYRYRASDGTSIVETDPTLGPYVYAPAPDVLGVSKMDLADFVVDEGAQGVPFLGLVLSPSGEVAVTALKVDVIGTISPAEVTAVHLYHDVDQDGTPDVLLGTQFFGATREFTGLPLQVTVPTSLMFLVDLRRPGTADALVGLEVADASYITVGPGDSVVGFPPYRSTRPYVNVPPAVADLTVDGHPSGSVGLQHIVRDAPALAWRFTDANAADVAQAAFNVTVSAGPTVLLSRNEMGPSTSRLYDGQPLVDGAAYEMTVSVWDGRLWSAPVSLSFRMNTPPSAPGLLAPTDLATDQDPNVTIILWNPVVDADGDLVTYTYWVSENPGFSPFLSGLTSATGATPPLQPGRTYYWKVGASDGYEFAGNATVWRFTTAGGGPPPVRGEIHGRVLNGTTPLPLALVELLVGDTPVTGQLTALDGTFAFRNLDLQAYTVRLSAFGFQPTTRPAAPTLAAPIVDVGDVPLTRFQPPDPDDGTILTSSSLPLVVLIVLLVLALALSMLSLFLNTRGRREEKEPAEGYECPSCGRTAEADATSCECGAEFEEPRLASPKEAPPRRKVV